MKSQTETDIEMCGHELKVYHKKGVESVSQPTKKEMAQAISMSLLSKVHNNPRIPTGADYHICKAKSAIRDLESSSKYLRERSPEWYTAHYAGEGLESLARALEVMRDEQRKKERE